MEWIAFTIFAALMQSVRTAGQKQMATHLNAIAATWARYGYGLPVAIVYAFACYVVADKPEFTLSAQVWFYIGLASIAQLVATLLLVRLLKLRNFAVGTTYAKTEAILAALLAVILFGRSLSLFAWLAVLLGVVGILCVSWRKAASVSFSWDAAIQGIGAGLGFAVTSVLVREATALMNAPVIATAAFILAWSIAIQLVLCTALLQWKSPKVWSDIKHHQRMGWFIGVTGALGSIGWYTAFGYQEAALVKTLGQMEFLFTVALTLIYFKEKIQKLEWVGMLFIVSSVVLILFA